MGSHFEIHGAFRGVQYNQKNAAEIEQAMERKLTAVSAKIQERGERIRKLKAEYEITDAALVEIITRYNKDVQRGIHGATYSNSISNSVVGQNGPKPQAEKLIPAGVISNLMTEMEYVQSELEEVERMKLILANLQHSVLATHPTTGATITREAVHTLTDSELRYLGFDTKAPPRDPPF